MEARWKKVAVWGVGLFLPCSVALNAVFGFYVITLRAEVWDLTQKLDEQEEGEEEEKEEDLDYEIVYEKDGFKIREAFLGEWKNHGAAEDRLDFQNLLQEINPYGSCAEELQNGRYIAIPPCTITVEASLSNGESNKFEISRDLLIGGHHTLRKNDKVIWEEALNPGVCGPVHKITKIGGEIAIDYSNLKSENELVDSILVTEGNTVKNVVQEKGYDEAFAPYVVQNRLVYIARKNNKDLITFGHEEIDVRYDEIKHICCCDGPQVSVLGDGEIIFLRKER